MLLSEHLFIFGPPSLQRARRQDSIIIYGVTRPRSVSCITRSVGAYTKMQLGGVKILYFPRSILALPLDPVVTYKEVLPPPLFIESFWHPWIHNLYTHIHYILYSHYMVDLIPSDYYNCHKMLEGWDLNWRIMRIGKKGKKWWKGRNQ